MSVQVKEGRAKVGILEEDEMFVVYMTRALFMKTVKDTLRDFPDYVGENILPIAEVIKFFPFDTWVAKHRGCGCLVGEYMIRNNIIDREEQSNNRVTSLQVHEWLSSDMVLFGEFIDMELQQVVVSHIGDTIDFNWLVLVIVDVIEDEA